MRYHVIAVFQLYCLRIVLGHGRLIDPPSRGSMWRYGFNTPPNYDDNQLYCGGVQVQYEVNGGKCGVCGDPWNGPRAHEPPGRFAKGIVVRKYSPGEIITVVVEMTANHKGWMEFKICPNDDPRKTVTQECLNDHVLKSADTNARKYMVPNENGYQKIRLKLRLPEDIKCKYCVFQWMYNAGNSWGTDPVTGRGCIGCGNQEQFYGCADVAIGYDDVIIAPHRPLPADTEEDVDDSDAAPPEINWNWSGRIDDKETKQEIKTIGSDTMTKSFSFMPVMNNGMSPCMCICKRAPLKLAGGAKNSLEVQFFKNMEGEDNQVCMCMCQNSSSTTRASLALLLCAFIFIRLLVGKTKHLWS